MLHIAIRPRTSSTANSSESPTLVWTLALYNYFRSLGEGGNASCTSAASEAAALLIAAGESIRTVGRPEGKPGLAAELRFSRSAAIRDYAGALLVRRTVGARRSS
jgi:hypothetical protein